MVMMIIKKQRLTKELVLSKWWTKMDLVIWRTYQILFSTIYIFRLKWIEAKKQTQKIHLKMCRWTDFNLIEQKG